MNGLLLDTNCVSELRRPNPSRRVMAFLAESDLDRMYISTVNLMEVRFGILSTANEDQGSEISLWLRDKVRPMFSGRVLEVTEDIMLRWRVLIEAGRKAGRTYSQPDLLIAATALEHNLMIVTRNVRDFAGLGVAIVNPWDEQDEQA